MKWNDCSLMQARRFGRCERRNGKWSGKKRQSLTAFGSCKDPLCVNLIEIAAFWYDFILITITNTSCRDGDGDGEEEENRAALGQ